MLMATKVGLQYGDNTSDVSGAQYIVATGGTITCCGDYKIHTFTAVLELLQFLVQVIQQVQIQ
jgi:L-asparaginase/Glu-tRNA(Gln) amidotransferase subunit D